MMQAQPPRYNGTHSSPHSSRDNADNGDSDDGGQQSGDDMDNDLDEHGDVVRPGKRKRPISVSCELCKQRKVKCDRGQPSCGWCTRNGALCEYKERKKPGLRAGYGRELEQRLDKLEAILRTHSEILQAHVTSNTSPTSRHSVVSSASHPPAPQSVKGSLSSDQGTPREPGQPSIFSRPGAEPIRTPQAETALFLQRQPPADFGMSATGGRTHDGMAGMTSVPSVLPSSTAAQEYYGTGTPTQDIRSPTISASRSQGQVSDQDLPPYDLLFALVDLYFKHVNTWCPILHRKRTLDSLFGPSMIDEEDKILLHAIVATTLRYSTDARLTDETRRRYHDVSKQRVLLHGMEKSTVRSLQALVVLALDLCGSGNGPPGWNIMALITRAVVQLGLAVEDNSLSVSPNFQSIYTLRAMILPEPRDFIEEESRRRLFWMVYLLDRYATIATAFEFALDDREIDRALPCRDDLWVKNQKVETKWFRTDEGRPSDMSANGNPSEYEVNKPENLGAFSYYVEILGILSKIHKFLKQPVDIGALSDVEQWQMRYKALDNMLSSWKFGLPNEFGNMSKLFQPASAKSLNCGWIMLHATYHTAVIRLHSSAAYPTTRSPIFTPSYSAAQMCHSAVENITALGEFVVNHGFLVKLGPPFAFTLWVAARVLLVHGSTVEHKIDPQITFLVETLKTMGQYWPVAERYCQLLTRVLEEHRASERQGDGVTPSAVKILADMRRTAYDLDVLISRAPRHVPTTGPTGTNSGNNWQGRINPSGTPTSRTPAPNELEYLDVFDHWFNMPRVPYAAGMHLEGNQGGSGAIPAGATPAGAVVGGAEGVGDGMMNGAVAVPGQFNITDYMVDQNQDWLSFRADGGKYMA
ncbi:fungal-specific transcription factor domain-containing protein [Cercophora newfieldiana]|uniref:Fungal-specific transcription factor domain-containing protein n=1 Tax=Cercophora newfieldiana TaxID=92897 RepID=A0AA40CNL8_9PEZI|nr:fungal-specific transcription factor domain-containing protein [Cercophora newfieldiana]